VNDQVSDVTVVLRDNAGAYYRLTPELLERARVPAEEIAALEAQLGEADDTGGYVFLIYTVGVVPAPPAPVESQAEKRLDQQRKDLTRNWAG
jgi:hypothetical protein